MSRSLSTSLGEAFEKALGRALERVGRAYSESLRLSYKLVGEAGNKRLLKPVHDISPPDAPVYGVDGSLARVRLGSRMVAVLHAVSVKLPNGLTGEIRHEHIMSIIELPQAGIESEEALETGMIALETLMLAYLAKNAENKALVFIDGPLADPPWQPKSTPVLWNIANQLSADHRVDAGNIVNIHQWRRSVLAEFKGRVHGVVKRISSSRFLSFLGGLDDDDAILRSLLIGLKRRGLGPHYIHLAPLREGVYGVYGSIHACYVLDTKHSSIYRLEMTHTECEPAVQHSIALTLPGHKLPLPILLAHSYARIPHKLLERTLGMIVSDIAKEAGSFEEVIAFFDQT